MALSQPAPASAAGAPAVRNPQSSRPNWLYPTVVVVIFSAFIVYGVVVGLFESSGRYGPYLSPFFSPEIYLRIRGFLLPPGIWIAPFPPALRHLFGGTDCFSCHRVRYQLWKGVTVLNVNHEAWAWASMLSVWGTDVYIRLLIHGVIPHGPWN